jgi:GAF domain-containing protein
MTVLLSIYAMTQQRTIIQLHARLEDARFRAAQTQGLHRNRLVAVHALSRTIGETNDPDTVFEAIAEICKDVFDGDRISIMTVRPSDRVLVVRAALGHPEGINVIGSTRQLGEGISGYVAQTREPLLLGPGHATPPFAGESSPSAHNLHSGMVVPLVVRDEIEGVISLANGPDKRPFNPDDLMTLQVFADIAEYFIHQTEKSNWMRRMIADLRDTAHEGLLDPDAMLVN